MSTKMFPVYNGCDCIFSGIIASALQLIQTPGLRGTPHDTVIDAAADVLVEVLSRYTCPVVLLQQPPVEPEVIESAVLHMQALLLVLRAVEGLEVTVIAVLSQPDCEPEQLQFVVTLGRIIVAASTRLSRTRVHTLVTACVRSSDSITWSASCACIGAVAYSLGSLTVS